ncbi:DinB family protein [Paenibacillus sp. CN-4]|uniref:DinB family protein n=1 Tax=Paenibacillus nanchangensis TaxID=3348343 RepID=UPI00397ACA23
MGNKHRLLEELEDFADFASSLCDCPDEVLCGKITEVWTLCDVISHITGWDRHLEEHVVHQLLEHEPVQLGEHPDVQAFNEASVAWGRSLIPQELLDEAVTVRRRLIAKLRVIAEETFQVPLGDRGYTLERFLQEMFVEHDLHHKEQILHFFSAEMVSVRSF